MNRIHFQILLVLASWHVFCLYYQCNWGHSSICQNLQQFLTKSHHLEMALLLAAELSKELDILELQFCAQSQLQDSSWMWKLSPVDRKLEKNLRFLFTIFHAGNHRWGQNDRFTRNNLLWVWHHCARFWRHHIIWFRITIPTFGHDSCTALHGDY